MTLPKYHASNFTVRMHPQGKYYRVADVEPVLATYEALLAKVLVTLLDERRRRDPSPECPSQ